jgi:hypothetical protein
MKPTIYFLARNFCIRRRLFSACSSLLIIARYLAWLRMNHPPSISSIRLPSNSFELENSSRCLNFSNDSMQLLSGTLAKLARPGMLHFTFPSLSARANIVIQTIRVWSSSCQTVEPRMVENNFVKPVFILAKQ